MIAIPFTILPPPLVLKIARRIKGIGNFVAALFPGLKSDLLQVDMELPAREYAGAAVVVGISNLIIISLVMLFIGYATETDLVFLSAISGIIVGGASFTTVLTYPKILSVRRTRSLEGQLIPALRQLLIEIRSGVPLFQALTSVSQDYGEVSVEFRKMVNEMNAGVSQSDAISEAARRIPSFRFRRVLWQINNALKVGSDLGVALGSMLDELTRERVDDIRRYGQELNPWVMLYMIAAVVIPSLGITMLIIVLSFLNIPVPKIVFPGILVLLMLFQVFFISFVKSRRPTVEE